MILERAQYTVPMPGVPSAQVIDALLEQLSSGHALVDTPQNRKLDPVSEEVRRILWGDGRPTNSSAQPSQEGKRTLDVERRMRLLDTVVGRPCATMESAFNRSGHRDAATLLYEFRTGTGPQARSFPNGSMFSRGFCSSQTTRSVVKNALYFWDRRAGGLQSLQGKLTGFKGTFVPIAPGLPIPGMYAKIIGTPEAHVIGSFALDGVLLPDSNVEWTARNPMSLPSYFGENWTKYIRVGLVSELQRPSPYGTKNQSIIWRTTLDGRIIP